MFTSVSIWNVVGSFHIIFVHNKHMPFGDEQLMFGSTHISWWVYGILFNILHGLDVVEVEYISY